MTIIKFNNEYAYRTAFTKTVFYAVENELFIQDINKDVGRMYNKEMGIMISVLHPHKFIKIEGNDPKKINSLESEILKIKEKEDFPKKEK